jgi:uncharacterized protein
VAYRSEFSRLQGVLIVAAAILNWLPLGVSADTPPPVAVSHQPTLYPGGVWEPGPATYGSTVLDDVPVTMDDGVTLRASVAYPTDLATGQRASGKFPVIIEHTPYVRLGQPVNPIFFLTEHGYIYAVIRARGSGTSGGEVGFMSARDGLDGKALVDWAYHLEGSDGRIALLGCSFPAGLALTDAAHIGNHSPVKAIVAACVGLSQVNRESIVNGGLMTTGFWNYTVRGLNYWGNSAAGARFIENFRNEIREGHDLAYDRDFWHEHSPLEWTKNIEETGIPVLLWSGWQDIMESGAIRVYTALQNAHDKRDIFAPMTTRQATTPRYQIIMGNWPHAAGLDVGIYLQWLETWVRGVDTGIENTRTPMHLFEPGTNRWVNAAQFPFVTENTAWHLAPGETLQPGAKNSGKETLVWGDPAQIGSKLNFTTPPFPKGATLSGAISATIYASSSNTNLELIAHLYDVSPDGSSIAPLAKGVVLGSQHELDRSKTWTDKHGIVTWPWPTLQRDDYLKPDEVYRFDIALGPRQWAINPDHRLRLELTTQSPADVCPPADLPPKNEPNPCRLTAPQQVTVPGATYKILYGAKWPSALNLPQLPWKSFTEVRSGVPPTAWSENQRKLETRDITLPLDWGK